MFSQIFSYLSSIKVKLFLWFWLIALCSIVITRFVLNQLASEHIIAQTDLKDVRKLNRSAEIIKVLDVNDISSIFKKLSINNTRKDRIEFALRNIIIKDMTTGEVHSARADWRSVVASDFITDNTFKEQLTWQFSKFRLTGPIEITKNNKPIQLFIKHRVHAKHFKNTFFNMPPWLRILIPFVVSLTLCWFLARTLSKPLSRIKKVATQLGDGNLSVRVDKDQHRKDELGSLAASFNLMAEKLEKNHSAQQRLLGDVSHELRSPLTRLQMALGLAQNEENDKNTLQKYLARCELEVSRLDDMIGHVLELSRLENTIQTIVLAPNDIKKLLETLIQDAQFIADEKHIDITLEGTYDKKIMLNEELIASAIGNIINNAVKYGPEYSKISIVLKDNESNLEILISDQGEGVPDNALQHLFDPFYRVSTARDRDSGGTGLGLAIARQAIQAHHGNIFAKNNSDVGLTVAVVLPNS